MIAENVEIVRRQIAGACTRAGRNEQEVTLIAVTKMFRSGQIREAMDAGVHDFGENYVQELLQKRSDLPGEHIRWHFIGHLQSNKVRRIVDLIAFVHAVDSLNLAEEISKQAAHIQRT